MKSEDDKLFERFQKECPNGEFSPGQFCKDYARGKYSKAGPTDQEKDRYERYCKMKDAEPSHSDKAFCKWYEDRYGGKGHGSSTGTTGHGSSTGSNGTQYPDYEKPEYKRTDDYEETQPAASKKADKGSLPFTGLEIWQPGLLGIVLVGGGFGARRLLAS